METLTVHVDRNNSVSFTCPHCRETFRVSVARYKDVKHHLDTRCSCGARFEVRLNFRRFYRKTVSLVGDFSRLAVDPSRWYAMTVVDLSMNGLRFTVSDTVDIKAGERLRVRFRLDNSRADLIDKEVCVRTTGSFQYGCEFTNLAFEEKELGFYLFSS